MRSVEDLKGSRIGPMLILDVLVDPKYPETRALWNILVQCECGELSTKPARSTRNKNPTGCGYNCKLLTTKTAKGRHDRKNHLKEPSKMAFSKLYSEYKRCAKARKKEFNISKEEAKALFIQNCYYCNRSPKKAVCTAWGDEFKYNGIDRVDNSKGYSAANCVPCCYMCNLAKHQSSKENFIAWIGRLHAKRDISAI